MKKKRLGEVLCERGHISAADLKQALQEQQGKVIHLGEMLLQRKLVSKAELAAALAEVSTVEYVDCQKLQPVAGILRLIPAPLAKRCRAIPIDADQKTLTVVMAEPQNLQLVDELRFKTGLKIITKFGFQNEVSQALERLYTTPDAPPEEVQVADDAMGMEFISSSSQERNVEAMREMQRELQQKSKTTPAVHLVATMIRAAVVKKASDIHVEPQQGETTVRFRIDGILRQYQKIPRGLQNTVASRVKILSDMDIAERRAPQDGRFLVKIGGRRIDLRVSTLPTQYGEKVVMRLLEGDSPLKDFASLGIPKEIAGPLMETVRLPQGMLLVTGPTGSGKGQVAEMAQQAQTKPAQNTPTKN